MEFPIINIINTCGSAALGLRRSGDMGGGGGGVAVEVVGGKSFGNTCSESERKMFFGARLPLGQNYGPDLDSG